MPAKAVKPEIPPSDLTDRQEGWGVFGGIKSYNDYADTGEWPLPKSGGGRSPEQPETSDGNWYRNGELI